MAVEDDGVAVSWSPTGDSPRVSVSPAPDGLQAYMGGSDPEDLSPHELVMFLVRPGPMSLIDSSEERRVCARFGTGTGRVSKNIVTSGRQLRDALAHMMAAARLPVLLTANQEGGRLNALDWPDTTVLPGNMALGATDDPGLAYAAGTAIGAQMRCLGVTWNLAPCCDLASRPSNPALGNRCFGDDPDRVAALAAAFVQGLQREKVAATVKHFPGLTGTSIDPHNRIPVTRRLASGALVPFGAAIRAGVAAVMVGAHVVREIDADNPAVFSARVIDGLLRSQMAFTGVVVTENLSIPAVVQAAGGIGEAAVRAVAAGADVVLLDSEVSKRKPKAADVSVGNDAGMARRAKVVHALVAALASGRLSRARVVQSARRVIALHQRFGVTALPAEQQWDSAETHATEVAVRIARHSVTVLPGPAGVLPLRCRPGQAVSVIRVAPTAGTRADSSWHAPFSLPGFLERYAPVAVVDLADRSSRQPLCCTIVVTHDAKAGPADPCRSLVAASGTDRPVVHVAVGDPGDLLGCPAQVRIAVYNPYQQAMQCVADVLFGRASATGALPVIGTR